MNLIFYGAVTEGAWERLQRVIEALVPEEKIEIYRSIDRLAHRLRQPTYNLDIAILLATTREDLLNIISLSDLLEDIRIILVLPDRELDTIRKGHSLRPRFLSYADSDFAEVAAVLSKMVENTNLSKGDKREDEP